jgi:hypothetical protein
MSRPIYPRQATTNPPTTTIRAIGFLTCLLACQTIPGRAVAGVILVLRESGGNVVATATGSINLTALRAVSPVDITPFISPTEGEIFVGPAATNEEFEAITPPQEFGPGGLTRATSVTGQSFGIAGSGGALDLPTGYTSEAPLSGTATWSGQTFASLGITPGTYTFTWGSGTSADFFTINAAVVPEPPSIVLAAIGSVVIFAGARFRQARNRRSEGPVGPHRAAE